VISHGVKYFIRDFKHVHFRTQAVTLRVRLVHDVSADFAPSSYKLSIEFHA